MPPPRRLAGPVLAPQGAGLVPRGAGPVLAPQGAGLVPRDADLALAGAGGFRCCPGGPRPPTPDCY